ncbi:hypothetical protein BDB01DRAFT_845949 [Pilobolus umbonatus]|nr:hypothetical protein BDB01DRAFT_845949 [Pilobolus umbonatus]
MPQHPTLPFFRQKRLISSLNVPRRYEIPVTILRALSFLPACINSIHNIQSALLVSERDAGGSLLLQTTRTEYYIAILWCLLGGYWSWILATSMMKRWLYHYEIKHAIIRLLTLIVVIWCISAFISSTTDSNEPIKTQMIISFILLLFNLIKLTFASSTKYSQKLEDVLPTTRFNLKNTAIRILLLPLLGVMISSAFILIGQFDQFQYRHILLMDNQFRLNTMVSSELAAPNHIIMILILSSWTPKAAERRQWLRNTNLQWLDERPNVIYRFVLGEPPSDRAQSTMGPNLIKESSNYQDMLVVPAPDGHSDKSKKLFQALKWAASIEHSYLVKSDDDVYVRWDTVMEELSALPDRDNVWKGFVYRNMPADHSVTIDYGLPILPAYTSGTLYTLSYNLVGIIANIDYPQRFVSTVDDGINLAMWLFGFDIQPIHDKRIQPDIDVCEESMIAKRVKLDQLEKITNTMHSNIINHQPQCQGLTKTLKKCALCYPCYGKTDDWRASNLNCDMNKGLSPNKLPNNIKKMPDTHVRESLPSDLGDSDEWIIPGILSAQTSIYSDTENWHLLYWVCWTSSPSTFTDRHWRALEMVWIHEPEAAIIMMSNSLPSSFFEDYNRRGYNIQVVRFNKENLLKWNWYFGPGTHDWLQNWEQWEKGKFFYWHLTDYIRCLLLYNYGGTYMDMDAIWTRIPPDNDLEFIGSDYSSSRSDTEWTLDDQGLYLPQGLMRFKRGWKLFREMAEGAFSAYVYDPECFNCGGPKAITSYVRDRRRLLEENGMTILPWKVLYPVSYNEIHKLLQPNPLAEQVMKNKIEPFSWNIHLFGKMTNKLPVQPGSVIDFVFKKFDLDLPHRDTKSQSIISSTGRLDVPFRLMGPRDYIYRARSDKMLEDDKNGDNLLYLQSVPGKFQGLDVIYARGGPEIVPKVTIELEATIGRVKINNSTLDRQLLFEATDASMQQINSMLNTLEYHPPPLMVANGGRDKLKVVVTYDQGEKVEKEQLQITMVVMEPWEENENTDDTI